MKWLHTLFIVLFSIAGFGAGYFFAEWTHKCPPQINCEHFCEGENESLISSAEAAELWEWSVYTEGFHKDTIYVNDFMGAADFITIYSDGELYAGRNRVRLSSKEKRRVKAIYEKVRKFKSSED